jgi:adenylosuccinate synthase
MPYHVALDGASEMRLGRFSIGTTRRGIGPCYQDKAARIGIRAQDLLDPKILVRKLEIALETKNEIMERIFGLPRMGAQEIADALAPMAARLAPFIADTSLLVDRALRDEKNVLLEGAQGTMLDVDHGTYPFVTSSNPIAGAACAGIGIGPTRISRVVGVSKAYTTRVGEGPFPTELDDADGALMLERGNEFGTTTGRQRRCGWIDLVALRYAARLSGFTELALTKLDVLSGFTRVRICDAYQTREGELLTEFPYHQTVFHGCTPVYRDLDGWDEDISECRWLKQLPEAARRYVETIAAAVEVPITLIGTGQGRHQVIDTVEF